MLFSMKLHIFLFAPLFFDVVPDMIFVSVPSNRIEPITLRPKLAAPQFLLYFWYPFEYFPRCDTSHYLTHSTPAQARYRLNKKMYMVCICPYFYETDLISPTYLQTYLFQLRIHFLREYYPPVLRRTYQMIQQYRYIVLLVDNYTHT